MVQTADAHQMGQQLLYPLDDPTTAFRNALQDMGINPYRNNPFVTQLQKNAQGSRIAFLSDMSRNQGPQGYQSNVMDNPAWADPSTAYGNFLHTNLQGGSLLNAMSHYAQNFGNSLKAVQAQEDQMAAGTNAASLNPYTSALREIYRADNGQGALAAYASLRSPALGSLGSSWTRALQNMGDSGMRNFAQQGGVNDEVWDYIFKGGMF
jgi:hypothetical protein